VAAELVTTGPAVGGGRVVGIDLGERRIGVSISDSKRVLATPHSLITRAGDAEADRRAIAAVVSEVGAGLVVVGLPLTLAGEEGPAAAAAAAEASALARELGVPVVLHDERLTTVEASRRRRMQPAPDPVGARGSGGAGGGGGGAGGGGGGAGGGGRSRARRPGPSSAAARARRVPIDAVAATVLLQAWLDEQRGTS
jgi:putative holliday junction resolvase